MAVTSFLKRTTPYWCAALHLVAAIGTVTLLRGGSDAVSDIRQRVAYMSEHPDVLRAPRSALRACFCGARSARRESRIGVVIASAALMLLFIPWVVVMGATQ